MQPLQEVAVKSIVSQLGPDKLLKELTVDSLVVGNLKCLQTNLSNWNCSFIFTFGDEL